MRRLRTYYVLIATQTLSIIGSRMTAIALGIRVFVDTGNATPLLFTTFFSELPAMLGNSFAGVLVDRWDRRRLLMLTDAGQAIGSLLLMMSFLSGHFQLWHLYAVALAQGIMSMFHEPANDTTTALLVPKERRERTYAIQQMAFPLAGVVAPALAGAVYALAGIAGVIVIDLTTFILAVIAVYAIRIPKADPSIEGRAAQGNVLREWRGGLKYLGSRPALLGLVAYYTIISFLIYGPLELAIPYLMTITGSQSLSGTILSISSLGALVGAALIAIWGRAHNRIHVMLSGLMLTGVMLLIYGTTRSPLHLAASIFLLTIPVPMAWTLLTSLLSAKTPPDLQGRVFAIVLQMSYIGSTVSFLVTGPLVDRVLEPQAAMPGEGMGLLLVGAGVMILLLTLVMYALPAIRRLESAVPDYEPLVANAVGD